MSALEALMSNAYSIDRFLNIRAASAPSFAPDGRHVAFITNTDDLRRFDNYVQKITEPNARLVQKGPGGYYSAHGWSPDDKSLLVYRAESNVNQDLFVVEVESGQVRQLTPHKGNAQYHSA